LAGRGSQQGSAGSESEPASSSQLLAVVRVMNAYIIVFYDHQEQTHTLWTHKRATREIAIGLRHHRLRRSSYRVHRGTAEEIIDQSCPPGHYIGHALIFLVKPTEYLERGDRRWPHFDALCSRRREDPTHPDPDGEVSGTKGASSQSMVRLGHSRRGPLCLPAQLLLVRVQLYEYYYSNTTVVYITRYEYLQLYDRCTAVQLSCPATCDAVRSRPVPLVVAGYSYSC
jgi:hypothetical protein